jgi:hypothetical protein
VVDHSVWARTHDGFVAVLCPYPVRGRSIGTQHIDDLNNLILFSDDTAMKHKSVTSAGVHDTILSQTFTFSIRRSKAAREGRDRMNYLPWALAT